MKTAKTRTIEHGWVGEDRETLTTADHVDDFDIQIMAFFTHKTLGVPYTHFPIVHYYYGVFVYVCVTKLFKFMCNAHCRTDEYFTT